METTRLMEAAQMLPTILAVGLFAVAAGFAALVYRARSR